MLGSYYSGDSNVENLKLSGNVMIPFGSKFIHCPAPSDYKVTG